jgi:hypothetical protein
MHLVVGYFIVGTYKKFAEKLLNDNSYISLIGSLGAIFGGIRFQWGPLVDYFSFKVVYTVILILQIILGFSFPFFAAYHYASFAICICLIFFCEGAHFTLMPLMITRLFGDTAEVIYPFAFSFLGVSQLFTFLLETFILKGDFEATYYTGSALCLVSLAILFTLFKDEPFKAI